jgi:hypothetical protein
VGSRLVVEAKLLSVVDADAEGSQAAAAAGDTASGTVPQQIRSTEAQKDHDKKFHHIKVHHQRHHKGHGHSRKHKQVRADAAAAAEAADRAQDAKYAKYTPGAAQQQQQQQQQQQASAPQLNDAALRPVLGFNTPIFEGVTSLLAVPDNTLVSTMASLQSLDIGDLGSAYDAAPAQYNALDGSMVTPKYSSSLVMPTYSSSSDILSSAVNIGSSSLSSSSSSSPAEPQVVFQSSSAENWQPEGEALHIKAPSSTTTPEAPPAAAAAAAGGPTCNPTLVQQQCDPQHPPPESSSEGARAYWETWRSACCKQLAPKPPEQGTNATDSEEYEIEYEYVVEDDAAEKVELRHNPPSPDARLRSDLARDAPINTEKPALQLGTCVTTSSILVPRFQTTFGGPMNSQLQTAMSYAKVDVPARLSGDLIRRVKTYVMSKMHTFDPVMGVIGPDPVRSAYLDLKWVDEDSHFTHPAGSVGPAELALLKVGCLSSAQCTHSCSDVLKYWTSVASCGMGLSGSHQAIHTNSRQYTPMTFTGEAAAAGLLISTHDSTVMSMLNPF